MLELASELGLETFPTYHEGRNLLQLGGKRSRYKGTIPRLSPLVLLDVDRARRRLNRLADGVPPEAPWSAPDAEALDDHRRRLAGRHSVSTRKARALFEIAVGTAFGVAPQQMSLLWMLHLVRSCGGFDAMLDVEGEGPSRTGSSAARRRSAYGWPRSSATRSSWDRRWS